MYNNFTMMPSKTPILKICFLLCVVSSNAFAKEVQIIKNGSFVPDYQKKIESLRDGDVIISHYANGETITRKLISVLSSDSSPYLFSTFAARFVELNIEGSLKKSSSIKIILLPLDTSNTDSFIKGAEQKKQIPDNIIIKYFAKESHPPYDIIVEDLDIKFTLSQFTQAFNKHFNPNRTNLPRQPFVVNGIVISPEGILMVLRNLYAFIQKTSRYKTDFDFHTGQVGFMPGRGWIWFDFLGISKEAKYSDESSLFSESELPFAIANIEKEVTFRARQRLGLKPAGCLDIFATN